MTTFPLHEALVEFEDNLAEIRVTCVANAEDVVATYKPAKELDVDEPITKETIHMHVNYLQVQEKLAPMLRSIKAIDSYRHYKANPVAASLITDSDIQMAKSVGEDWFIQQANLSTRKPSKGLCPFHNDSNASLMLMKSKKTGHLYLKCFPCGKAWNSVDFLMERDNLSFMEAVRRIINK